MSEREKFMARLAEARAGGLVDMKFFFEPSKAMKPDEVFGAMNQVEAAVKKGHRHTEWNGNKPV